MSMTKKELEAIVIDPSMTRVHAYNNLQYNLVNDITIPDPTNPFVFLMDNTAMLVAASLQSVENSMRKTYPALATNKLDLYNHLDSSETFGIFSTPSVATFNIYIGKKEALRFSETKEIYNLVTIPKNSFITVDNNTFTLLNDIEIYLYSDGSMVATLVHNTTKIANSADTLLPISTIKDKDGKEWIFLEVDIKQITRYDFRETILSTTVFNTTFNLGNQELFTYLEAFTVNGQTGTTIPVKTTFSNFVYNPSEPTIIVRPIDNAVNLELPITYNVSGIASAYINFKLYTTKGNIELPLLDFNTSDFEFTVTLPDVTSPSTIGINNIPIKVNSTGYTTGGTNELSFDELKYKIINYTTGDNLLPITLGEIQTRAEQIGFIYRGKEKTLLKNTLLVTKNIGNLKTPVNSTLFTTQATTKLLLNQISSDKIKYSDKRIIIEPYQMFKQDKTFVTPLSTIERNSIAPLVSKNILKYNDLNLLFNLYKYVIDYTDTLDIRAYDVNEPTISNISSLNKSSKLIAPVVITEHRIINKINLYEVILTISINSGLGSLDIDYLYGQLKLDDTTYGSIYYKGKFIINNDSLILSISIPVEDYINKNNEILALDSDSTIKTLLLPLITKSTLTIYSTDNSIASFNTKTLNEIVVDTATVLLYEETFDIKFGTLLDNLHTGYTINYTKRKFMKHTESKLARYQKTIYKQANDGTPDLTFIDTDGDGTNDDVKLTILHNKNDVILDDKGNPTYEYKVGDVILNKDTMTPVVDPLVGVEHIIDLLLLEDIFLRATDTAYMDYRIKYFRQLTKIISSDLEPIATELLDNTKIKFTGNKNLANVEIITNNVSKFYTNIVSPRVDCYVKIPNLVATDELTIKVYNYLQDKLLYNLSISEIEQGIKQLIPYDTLVVKLSGLSENDDINILNYAPNSNKFLIKKILAYNDTHNTIVIPDFKINFLTIQGS